MKQRFARVLGLALVMIGPIWIAQSRGILPASSMTGQPLWAVCGVLAVVAGVMLWRYGRGPRA